MVRIPTVTRLGRSKKMSGKPNQLFGAGTNANLFPLLNGCYYDVKWKFQERIETAEVSIVVVVILNQSVTEQKTQTPTLLVIALTSQCGA